MSIAQTLTDRKVTRLNQSDRRLDLYSRKGHRRVQGWLEHGAIALVRALERHQRLMGINGHVAEVGVHHGRFFILLDLLAREGEKSTAIDVFDKQYLNIDSSGKGNRVVFERNVKRWGRGMDTLITVEADSSTVSGDQLRLLVNGRFRLFSVDGGHTAEITSHDLAMAQASLTDGGLVILDDCFNYQWPGVIDGTYRYIAEGGELVPAVIGFNKTVFTQPARAAEYMRTISTWADKKGLACRKSMAFSSEVIVVFPRTLKDRTKQIMSSVLRRRRLSDNHFSDWPPSRI